MRVQLWPLAWALGIVLGAALALSLGAYGPAWGSALAFPAVALLFAIGAVNEHEGESITHLLRLTLGFTLGFLVATIPITVLRLADLGAATTGENGADLAAELARVRNALLLRWLVSALALPLGVAALWTRRLRSRSASTGL